MHGFSLRSNNLWLNKLIREFYWELVGPQPPSILLFYEDSNCSMTICSKDLLKVSMYTLVKKYIQIDEKKYFASGSTSKWMDDNRTT